MRAGLEPVRADASHSYSCCLPTQQCRLFAHIGLQKDLVSRARFLVVCLESLRVCGGQAWLQLSCSVTAGGLSTAWPQQMWWPRLLHVCCLAPRPRFGSVLPQAVLLPLLQRWQKWKPTKLRLLPMLSPAIWAAAAALLRPLSKGTWPASYDVLPHVRLLQCPFRTRSLPTDLDSPFLNLLPTTRLQFVGAALLRVSPVAVLPHTLPHRGSCSAGLPSRSQQLRRRRHLSGILQTVGDALFVSRRTLVPSLVAVQITAVETTAPPARTFVPDCGRCCFCCQADSHFLADPIQSRNLLPLFCVQ